MNSSSRFLETDTGSLPRTTLPGNNTNTEKVSDLENSRFYQPWCYRSWCYRLRAPVLLTALTLAGCNLLPVGQGTLHAAPDANTGAEATARVTHADSSAMPQKIRWGDGSVAEQSQLMYELMIAELAGRRGYVDLATDGYYSASKRIDDPRVSERATKLAVWSRRWVQAEESGKRWAELAAENSEVHQLLAQIYMRQGKSSEAANELNALIKTMSSDSSVSMADIYAFLIREPNRKVAVETMVELRNKYSEDSYANLALAQLAFAAKDKDTALEAVDKSLAIKPENHESQLLRAKILSASGQGDRGFEELEKAIEFSPDDLDLHIGYARLLVEAGRYDEASDELEVTYGLGYDNAGAVYTIGLLALESRRNNAAEKYFTQLLSLDQYRSEAHFYLGQIVDSRQQYVEAIEHYESVVDGDTYINAQIRAAELYAATGRPDLGQQRLQQLRRENSNPALQPGLIRAEARILIDANRTQDAIKILNTGLENFPNNSDLLYSRALAAESVGNKDLFVQDLKLLIRNEPDNAHALNALGYHYTQQNIELDEAEKLLVKANELLPQDPAILDSLGWLQYRQGDLKASLKSLRRAYLLLKDSEIASHLGEVLWVSGEQESAKDIWNRALAEQPGDANLKSVMERFVQ